MENLQSVIAINDPYRISVTIRDIHKLNTQNISNVMVNINKYFVFQNIQTYNYYLIHCDILI